MQAALSLLQALLQLDYYVKFAKCSSSSLAVELQCIGWKIKENIHCFTRQSYQSTRLQLLDKKRDEEKKDFKQAASSLSSGLQKPAECKKLA